MTINVSDVTTDIAQLIINAQSVGYQLCTLSNNKHSDDPHHMKLDDVEIGYANESLFVTVSFDHNNWEHRKHIKIAATLLADAADLSTAIRTHTFL